MPFPTEIQNALQVYDQNKGFFRRLFGDQSAIRKLRKLTDVEKTNFLKVYQCFIENLPKSTQASYKVYQAIISFLDTLGFNGLHQAMDQLHAAKLSTPQNLEKLIEFKANHFKLLTHLLTELSKNNLLNSTNFEAISEFFETSEEDIPIEFTYITKAINILSNSNCLNQDNFNYILEKPSYAINIATILVTLNETNLLNSANLSRLYHSDNQFLFSDEACSVLWTQFKDYLNKLLVNKTNQTIFDSIVELAKQENPKTKIESYMDQLNSQVDMYRKIFPFKYSTTPRGSQEQLLDSSELTSSLTKSGTL